MGDAQMSILLHMSYLLKWPTKGDGGKNAQKTVHMVYGWPLLAYVVSIWASYE